MSYKTSFTLHTSCKTIFINLPHPFYFYIVSEYHRAKFVHYIICVYSSYGKTEELVKLNNHIKHTRESHLMKAQSFFAHFSLTTFHIFFLLYEKVAGTSCLRKLFHINSSVLVYLNKCKIVKFMMKHCSSFFVKLCGLHCYMVFVARKFMFHYFCNFDHI